eukprot:GHUV01014185.1.p1 GENE.GHUV01014185.1~~GHUV01014185.1.p1  ORF type:complete len:245 (+),score=80.58 GHUV01014185.1:519-1253(+)
MSMLLSTRTLQHGCFTTTRPGRRCVVPASASPDQPSTSGRPEAPVRDSRGRPPPGRPPAGRPAQLPVGPNGRPMVMGPDGQPVEMVRMEERPEAFVGIAAVDRGENDNPSDPKRVALLAAGDLAVLLGFAAIGRHNHGEPLVAAETFTTALPFIVGWFTSAAFMGGFSSTAQGGNTGAAATAAAKTWAVGVPLGLVLRSISRGYVPATSFLGVSMGVTAVLMIGWRTALAAVTPQVWHRGIVLA